MRTFCAFVFCLLFLQFFISCQKQLSFNGPVTPAGDSVTMVKTIAGIIYDSSDVFMSEEWQTFTYDKSLNRTTVELADSDRYSPGQVQRYTATFQYDAASRLSQYTSTGGFEPAAQIDFTYGSSGDISKISLQDNWVGQTFDCNFTTSTQNGQKLIMEYDTSGLYNGAADTRPEISKYLFDTDGRLVNETIYYTFYRLPENLFEDTLTTNFFYDNNNFIYKVTDLDSYHSSPSHPPSVVTTDSTLYTSEGSNAALRNSFFYIYKNMYWLNISEFGTGFANAINKGGLLYYGSSAIKTGESWQFSPPDPAVQDHHMGIFQNTFDASGLLVKSVYPKNFANKYGGKSEVVYTYTKIKK
jgi:hypothetical protein